MRDALAVIQEHILTVLSDGGFADKRTELEAWTAALRSARRTARLLELAHERLKALGDTRGILGLADSAAVGQSDSPANVGATTLTEQQIDELLAKGAADRDAAERAHRGRYALVPGKPRGKR